MERTRVKYKPICKPINKEDGYTWLDVVSQYLTALCTTFGFGYLIGMVAYYFVNIA